MTDWEGDKEVVKFIAEDAIVVVVGEGIDEDENVSSPLPIPLPLPLPGILEMDCAWEGLAQ